MLDIYYDNCYWALFSWAGSWIFFTGREGLLAFLTGYAGKLGRGMSDHSCTRQPRRGHNFPVLFLVGRKTLPSPSPNR
jgi:hypothetical protein